MHSWTTIEGELVFQTFHGGKEYYFKKIGHGTVRLSFVRDIDANEDIAGDEIMHEDLPAPVRKALQDEQLTMRSMETTVTGAM